MKTFELKGTSYGLTLILDEDAPIEQVLRDICIRFAELRNKFGKAEMVLTVKGRSLNDEELNAIIQSVEFNSDITISLIEVEDQLQSAKFLKDKKAFEDEKILQNAKIHIGNITEGKTIRSDSGIVIIGDVDEGAEVFAAGNIIITGRLDGYASAGQPNNNDCFIYAGMIRSSSLVIAQQEGDLPKKRNLFKDRKKDGGDVLLFRKDHFIITNVQDEIFMNYPNKRRG